MQGLGAACGTGDGDSEGKHDRKHKSDIGLVDRGHHKIRCACCLFASATTALASTLQNNQKQSSLLFFLAWLHVKIRAAW